MTSPGEFVAIVEAETTAAMARLLDETEALGVTLTGPWWDAVRVVAGRQAQRSSLYTMIPPDVLAKEARAMAAQPPPPRPGDAKRVRAHRPRWLPMARIGERWLPMARIGERYDPEQGTDTEERP